jgi:hypothetical protein
MFALCAARPCPWRLTQTTASILHTRPAVRVLPTLQGLRPPFYRLPSQIRAFVFTAARSSRWCQPDVTLVYELYAEPSDVGHMYPDALLRSLARLQVWLDGIHVTMRALCGSRAG